jgi:hypothetical protein
MSADAVILTGPLFDGRAAAWTRDAVAGIRRDTAEHALDAWDEGMDATFRVNGHVYQSFAHVVDGDPEALVNDGYGVTNDLQYGPWLEGLGSRNSPVTRFPGYRNLRQAYVVTDRAVPDIASPRIDALTDRINTE